MAEIKPNHICKNPTCKKLYYACDHCDRTKSWRSVACSPECYQKYVDLVIAERSKGKIIKVKPERTDMTEKEVDELLTQPIEVIAEKTKEDLKDYANEDGNIDFANAVDEINAELNKKKTTARSKKKFSYDE